MAVTPEHGQLEQARYVVYYPAHEARRTDSHYALFRTARKRILAAGVGCWICGTREKLELHHAECEFAAAMGVDVQRLKALHPEYHLTDQESFLRWVESDGNLQILCMDHHRSPFCGIHHIPWPVFKLQRIWRQDIPPILEPPPVK